MKISLPSEELNAIVRALEPNGFNLIFIKYNGQESIVESIVDFVKGKFPQRQTTQYKVISEYGTAEGFFQAFEKLKEGIFFLTGFENVLANNKFYPSLNIQRDYLAKFNVSLVCFVDAIDGIGECQRKIPDLFSFRAHVSEFFWVDNRTDFFSELRTFYDFRFSNTRGKTLSDKLRFAISRITDIEDSRNSNSTTHNLSQFREISLALTECMLYKDALVWRKRIDAWPDKLSRNDYTYFNKCRISHIYIKLDDFDNALKLLHELSSNINESNSELKVEYYYSLSYLYFLKGDFSTSLETLDRLMANFKTSGKTYFSDLYFLQSVVYLYNKKTQQAIDVALNILNNNLEVTLDDTLATYLLLSQIYRKKGNFEEARKYCQKASQVANKPNNPYTALRHEEYALLLAGMGRDYDEALRHVGYGIKIARKIFSPDHPFIAKLYYSRARIYYLKGDHDKCIYTLRRTRKIFEMYYGNEHSLYKILTAAITEIEPVNVKREYNLTKSEIEDLKQLFKNNLGEGVFVQIKGIELHNLKLGNLLGKIGVKTKDDLLKFFDAHKEYFIRNYNAMR